MEELPFSHTWAALPMGSVELHHGMARDRRDLTRAYVASLKTRNLLQNHLLEAGLIQINERPGDIHWGWESPTSMVRAHYVGHWLSAASFYWATTGDTALKGQLDEIVAELGRCQEANGGEWVAGIPEKYLHWIKQGRAVWAPMYVAHKPLMGLLDAYTHAGSTHALDIVVHAARWFTRFTEGMSTDELDDLLDWETGGMQEAWCDLYGITHAPEHRELIDRFDRRRLIDRLVAGEDVLTNHHANQQVPEIMAAARAYEVTGETRWHDAVLAYWKSAVTDRGWFATGGQTFGEYWTPPHEMAARLGRSNQEHCVVFNMMRLAEKLLQWTGEAQYADYLERNRLNGIYAQQHPGTGMVAYYLPLKGGARKDWATPTETFSCCMATMIQAGSRHGLDAFYTDADGLSVAQYVSSTARWSHRGTAVEVEVGVQDTPPEPGRAGWEPIPTHRPFMTAVDIEVRAASAVEFDLRIRLPWWLAGDPVLTVDGERVVLPRAPGTFQTVRRSWTTNRVHLELPTALTVEPLPDEPGTVAFMDGPTLLAGLVDGTRRLTGDVADPRSMLAPAAEFEFGTWQTRWTTTGQAADFDLVPLHQVTDETYTVYFPVTP